DREAPKHRATVALERSERLGARIIRSDEMALSKIPIELLQDLRLDRGDFDVGHLVAGPQHLKLLLECPALDAGTDDPVFAQLLDCLDVDVEWVIEEPAARRVRAHVAGVRRK